MNSVSKNFSAGDLVTIKLPKYLIRKFNESDNSLTKVVYGASMLSWVNPFYLFAVMAEVITREAYKQSKQQIREAKRLANQ